MGQKKRFLHIFLFSTKNCGEHGAERGSVILLTLLALVTLLGLGIATITTVRGDLRASGSDKFSRVALYSAESGVAAAMEYLRSNCSATKLFSDFVEPSNHDPQQPVGIMGNAAPPGAAGNPFLPELGGEYVVTLLNNPSDPGFSDGNDTDGQLIVRAIGMGPDQSQTIVEVEIENAVCLAQYCSQDYAQRGLTARNDNNATAACSRRVTNAAARLITTGG
jgi:hypothetical protein